MNIIYVIGLPGSGKTTAVQTALNMLDTPPVEHATPIPHVRYGPIWHIGRHRENGFGGTDSLAMNINPKACDWLWRLSDAATDAPVGHAVTPRTLIGEGDRLANNRFLNTAHTATRLTGGRFTLIHLDCPPTEARARASIRARHLGTPEQNASWWKGRMTRIANIVSSRPVTTINALEHPNTIAHHIYATVNPPT